MTSTPTSTLRRVGGLAIGVGALFMAVGGAAWGVVSKQLRDEQITLPPNAPLMGGKLVQDPVSAFVQAEAIKTNAEKGAGGMKFAEVTGKIRQVDSDSEEAANLREQRLVLSTAASLRGALMTSVLAFGVSALIAGVGVLVTVAGIQLASTDDDA